MRTIPPDSRSTEPICPLVASATATSPPREAGADLALVATTQTYLAGLVTGDLAVAEAGWAWDEFYSRYEPVVARAARDSGLERPTPADVADAMQDLWLTVVERLGSFRVDAGLGSFPGWLRTVARRRGADRRRALRRRPVPPTWDEPPLDLAGPEADPAEACERADERAFLASLLERLRAEVSPRNYRLLHLRSIEDRSVAEVSDLLGLSPEQVSDRHYRLMSRLRELAGVPAASRRRKVEKNSPSRTMPGILATCM